MAKTKAPTGLKITRNGNVFTLTWKIGDKDYADGQYFSYLINDTGKDSWSKTASIGKKATSKAISINKGNFYPYNSQILYNINMAVKGNRKKYKKGNKTISPSPSKWSKKSYPIYAPNAPSVSMEKDEELTNRCTFSWGVDVSNTDSRIFTDVEWQSILVKNSNETDGSKLSWNSKQLGWVANTGGSSGSKLMTEDTAILYKNGDSYIRWFRVRSRGPRGVNGRSKDNWTYSYRVYALPLQANVKAVSASETAEGGFRCVVDWEAASSRQYPIDKTTAQYTIVKPDPGISCPSGASWTDADVSADTGGDDSATFSIDDQLSPDECLFVRINTHHDKITYGKPTLASVGYLKDPTNLSVDTDPETFRATISANNGSDVEDSVLVVRYVPASGDPIDVGVIEHGEDEIIVQCPDWSEQDTISFSVYAMVGKWSELTNYQLTADTVVHQGKSYFVRTGSGTDEDPYVYTLVTSPSGNPSEQEYYEISGVSRVSVDPIMRSKNTVSKGGVVPVAPKNVTVSRADNSGTIRVTWDWTWRAANGAEISWADHEDAWESTDEPETYIISNMKASRWNISGLEMGKTWWVRVRLFIGSIDGQGRVTYGPWSNLDAGKIDLSSAPNKPALLLSTGVIPEYGSVTASWVYTTIDNTPQTYAEIAVVEMNDIELPPERASEADIVIIDEKTQEKIYIKRERDYSRIIAHTETAQHITLNAAAENTGWLKGNIYNLACRVQSASGRQSEWSEVVSIAIADPLECEITQTSLVPQTETQVVEDPETGEETTITREFLALTNMTSVEPFTVTVEGAGEGGITSVEVQRAQSYHLERPDESDFNGYEGEIVLSRIQTGEEQISFDNRDLIGLLDDGASYRIVATIKDDLGQTSSASLDFEVHWSHQALIPSANFELDHENFIAKITPIAPIGADPADVADIYRLSIDKPELIVRGATFGVTYVDPYPALGEMGGHRVVLRTKNNDYITSDNTFAMIDSTETEEFEFFENEEEFNIIDFEERQVRFYYDTDYSNTWDKDFQETQYLGGSVQGDWNAGVSRTGTLSTQAITTLDQDMLRDVRRLAVYPGICHVRTADGSSYSADIQVSEDRVHDDMEMLANYSFSITRVDSQGFDGMTLEQWEQEHPSEQPEEEEEETDELEPGV